MEKDCKNGHTGRILAVCSLVDSGLRAIMHKFVFFFFFFFFFFGGGGGGGVAQNLKHIQFMQPFSIF